MIYRLCAFCGSLHEADTTKVSVRITGARNYYINFGHARVILNNFLDNLNFGVLAGRAYCQSYCCYHSRNVGTVHMLIC